MSSYREALQAIFQRTNYERQAQPPYAERVWRLDRMRELLHALGDPQQTYRAVHVAGTKGKGSTSAMIATILRTAGYRTGLYSSPHLHTFRERIRLQGEALPEQSVVQLVARLAPLLQANPEITVFEAITAMAMLYYAEQRADWGVFEVGMGGRLDATNVLLPEVAVITALSLDHTKVLGDTIEAIAREKGGIIKANRPVVVAPQQPGALQVIADLCAERSAPATFAGRDWQWRLIGSGLAGQRLAIFRRGNDQQPDYPELWLPLLGAHQMENACLAVAAVETLRATGADIDKEAVIQGLAQVEWPGRMEILGQKPLLIVDGAHNVHSTQCLLQAIQDYAPYERLVIVFGAGTTHNPQDSLRLLAPRAHAMVVTQAQHPRATTIAELAAMASAAGCQPTACATVEAALTQALGMARPNDLVLVTGSLFVVAEAREAWFRMTGRPALPSDPPGVYA